MILNPRRKTYAGLIELSLRGIEKFDFYFEKECFFDIERYKLFRDSNNLFYLSFDPYDEGNSPHKQDCALIICKEISGRIITDRV